MGVSHRHATPEARLGRSRGRPAGGAPAVDRDQAIQAAIRAVRGVGPGVTMEEIAAEAGVTKPIIYRALGDKEAIATAIAEHLSLRIEAKTFDVLRKTSDEPPEGSFRAAAYALFETLKEDRKLFLFVEYGWGSRDGRRLETMIERSAAPFIDSFARTRRAVERPPAAARTWAYATVGALRTVAVMWVRECYCSLDEVADEVTEYVFRSTPGERRLDEMVE